MKKFLNVFKEIDESITRFMKKKWAGFIIWPLVILFLYGVFFTLCYQQEMYDELAFNGKAAEGIFYGFLIFYEVLVIAYIVLLAVTKRLTTRKGMLLIFLLAAGLVFPFNMGRVYNNDDFTHDYSVFRHGGHWSIIYDIYATGKIPGVDIHNQYYQPKLYHAMMGYFIKFNSFFMPAFNGSDQIVPNVAGNSYFPAFTLHAYTAFETARILLTLQGILLLYFSYRTIVELGLKKKVSFISGFLLLFTPVFWFISAYKNNDALATIFMFAALFAALRYRKTHSYVSLVLTAITIGLGMEAKLSAAMVAFPVATIFLFELLKYFRKNKKWIAPNTKELTKFIIQMCVFAAIVFPLGLGGAILMKIQYDMPIGYVWDLIADFGTDYFMYIDPKIYSVFDRVILFPSPDLFWDIFNVRYGGKINGVLNPYGYIDFNCWTAFLKTGLWSESYLAAGYAFGKEMAEYPIIWTLMTFVYVFAIAVGIIFIIGSIVFIVKRVISLVKKEDQSSSFIFWVIAVTFVSSAISYMVFCIRYPVGCTMNARYGMLLYLPIAVVTASLINIFIEKFEKATK